MHVVSKKQFFVGLCKAALEGIPKPWAAGSSPARRTSILLLPMKSGLRLRHEAMAHARDCPNCLREIRIFFSFSHAVSGKLPPRISLPNRKIYIR